MKQNTFPIIILGVLIIGIIIIAVLLHIRKNKDLLRLWTDYEVAKMTGDKAKALEAGRAFYKRKKGTLTTNDEQILESDLSTLK